MNHKRKMTIKIVGFVLALITSGFAGAEISDDDDDCRETYQVEDD